MIDKQLLNIEDILLIFTDSGEIALYEVNKETPYFLNIKIIVNQDIKGFDKIKLFDKIIKRICRSGYDYLVSDDQLFISTKKFNSIVNDYNIIVTSESNTLFEKINKKLTEITNSLKLYNQSEVDFMEYRQYLYYGISPHEKDIYMKVDFSPKRKLQVSYIDIWQKFEGEYLINGNDIMLILEEVLIKKFPSFTFFGYYYKAG